MKVLAFLEQRDGVLKSSAQELLSTACEISGGNPEQVAGLIIGCGDSGVELCKQLENFGSNLIYVVDDQKFSNFNVLQYSAALKSAIEDFKPDVVLGIASPMGRELFPRTSVKVHAGLLTDLIDLKVDGGELVGGTKPLYAGKILAKAQFKNCQIKMATLRPNIFPAKQSSGSATCKSLDVALANKVTLDAVQMRKGENNKVDLTEATRIVSGGRAMGNADNFKILEQLAETFGASVGASRAAVDSGYASHDMQVGQTGKTVNPSIYIACGISGSIQHMAGMKTSKVIIAINTDSDAPIFSIADYGIVADLFEAVPILTKKIAEITS